MSLPVCAADHALRSAWESLLVALFTAALFRFLPRLTPGRRFAAAALGFALAAALPFCPAPVFHAGTASAGISGISLPAAAAPLLAGAWLLASSTLLLRLGLSAFSLAALLRKAQPAPPALQALYHGIARGRARRARLLLADIYAPSACGLLRPAVLLPTALPALLSKDELAAVLRHEAAHLNGGDDWLALGLRLTRALLPFAFGLCAIERRLLAAREMLCDDAALRTRQGAAASRKSYAACLARLAEPALRRANALAPGLGGSELSLRIGHILAGAQGRGPGKLRSITAAFAGAALCTGLLAAPALFTFQASSLAQPDLAQTAVPPLSAPPFREAGLELTPAAHPRPHRPARRKPAGQLRQPAVLQAVSWSAPQPHVVLLIPAAQVVSVPTAGAAWTRFFLITL